ncbi:MAG: PAS domain-containing protein [Gemmatimonadota bacterium]|nr:PAS domain-containing protein [Gemmatimonadota bacterium]
MATRNIDRTQDNVPLALAQLEEVFRQAPAFFAVLRGPGHVFERVNTAFTSLIGNEAVVGKTVLEAIPEIAGQGFIELLDHVLATGETYTARAAEARLKRRPDGPLDTIFVDFVYAPLKDKSGRPTGVIVHGADVTEQVEARLNAESVTVELEAQIEETKAVAEELEQSNDQLQEINVEVEEARDQAQAATARLREVLDSLAESVTVLDHDWRLSYQNPAAKEVARVLGKDPDTLLGRDIWEEIPELRGTRFEAETRRAVEEQRVVEYEEMLESLGRWFEVRAVPSANGVTTFSRDVTERYKAAEALAQNEEQFRALANLIPTLAWMADANGWIFWYNDRWYEYTGTTPAQMEGWGWQSVHDPEVLPSVLEQWTSSIATGKPFEMEFPLLSAAGEFRWFLTRVAPLKDNSGKVLRWFGTNTDVQAQHEATDAANAANKAKSDFLAAMSHETRQPINATLSFLQLMEMGMYGEINGEQKTALERMRKNQEQLLSVITDILSFARLEAGRVELQAETIDPAKILEELPAYVEPQITAAGLQFAVAPNSLADHSLAVGDRDKVLQILTNLLTNAIKATSAGGRISAGYNVGAQSVSFFVEDTGIGIAPDKIEMIFSPFVQLERALNRPREGVGLGLAISRDFAQAMGGTLTATSSPGSGSRFTLTLPKAV